MSQVLMCDNCGNLFSVNERNWRQYQITTNDPEDQNPINHGAQTRHYGPCCPVAVNPTLRPRTTLEIEARDN